MFQLQAVGYINNGTVLNAKFQIFYSKCRGAFFGTGTKLDYNRNNNKHYLLNEINVSEDNNNNIFLWVKVINFTSFQLI